MGLLTDAHVKRAYVTALRSDGHTVERVVDVETLGQTAADEEILADARARDAVILTNDTKDFADADTPRYCHRSTGRAHPRRTRRRRWPNRTVGRRPRRSRPLCNQLGATAPCREGTVASPTSLGFERGTIGAADESDDPVLRALNRATQLEGRVSVDGQTKEFQRALVSTIRCRLHHEPEVHIGQFPHMWLASLSRQMRILHVTP